MAELKAYYLEVPEKDFALLLMDDGTDQEIWTGTPEQGARWLGYLESMGIKPLQFQSTQHTVEDHQYRRWTRMGEDGPEPLGSVGRLVRQVS